METTRKVTCESCERTWKVSGHGSIYEREAIESRPCPCCGSYTLSIPEPAEAQKRSMRHAFRGVISQSRFAAAAR